LVIYLPSKHQSHLSFFDLSKRDQRVAAVVLRHKGAWQDPGEGQRRDDHLLARVEGQQKSATEG